MSATAGHLQNVEAARGTGATAVATCCVAMFISYLDRVNISVAALAMQTEFAWSDSLKGWILAAFFCGYVLTQVAGGWLAHHYGGVRVLTVAMVAFSLATVLTPLAAHLWLPALFAIRIGLGLSEGPVGPAVYSIFSTRVPAGARTRAVAAYTSAAFAGTVFALIATAWLVREYGWQSAFYVFGAIGLVYALFVPGLLSTRRTGAGGDPDPAAPDSRHAARRIPWRDLLRQRQFWALVVSFFCTCWVFYVLLLWMPSYFARVHGLEVFSSGAYSVAPWATMFIVVNLGGWFSDRMIARGWTTTATRKTLTAVGLVGAGLLLFCAKLVETSGQAMVLLCFTLAFVAVAYASQPPNVFDLAPRHAHVLYSILNTFGSLPGIFGVGLTGMLIDATASYDVALALAGGLAWLGAAVYVAFGTGRKLVD